MVGAWGPYGGKFCRTQPVGRPGHKWGDTTESDLKQICWEGMGWFNLAPDRKKWWLL